MARETDTTLRDLEQLEALADRMDSAFRLPGTKIRFGYDSLIGLIPGIGDALALAPSGYIVTRAHAHGASWPLLARMLGNIGLDALIGTIPFFGDIFDVGFKANRRNVALLRQHLGRRHPGIKTPRQPGAASPTA